MESPAIIQAIWGGSAKRVRQIVEDDPSALNNVSSGQAALHEAASGDHPRIGKVLLDLGADANIRDYGGRTPLGTAALNGAANMCRLLIERGALLDAYDLSDVSPLGWALYSWADGAARCVKLLRKAGATEDLITAIYSGDDGLIATLLVEKSRDERHRRQVARSIAELMQSWRSEPYGLGLVEIRTSRFFSRSSPSTSARSTCCSQTVHSWICLA